MIYQDHVYIEHTRNAEYPKLPFHPPQNYPEWKEGEIDSSNQIYEAVRRMLSHFGLDKVHEGTAEWNPFKGLVSPGDKVMIKPNLVFHEHPMKNGVESMISHGSVIRPLVEYAWKAMDGKGEITIGDVPLQTADWDSMMEDTGIKKMAHYLREEKGIHVKVLDLRLERAALNRFGVVYKRQHYHGDPKGYVTVNIGEDSMLMPVIDNKKNFTITDYPKGTVEKHHNEKVNEYLIPKTILESNIFINVPKLKTHKKAGVTLSMKNLIGINGDKSWIAHHREGSKDKNGDEFPYISKIDLFKFRLYVGLKNNRLGVWILIPMLAGIRLVAWVQRRVQKMRKPQEKTNTIMQFESITEGSWYGNDTLWRVILDLNRILLYADEHGKIQSKPQRKHLSIIDGIWGGECNGPMHHIPKRADVLIGGFSQVFVDVVATNLMGFDYNKIPQLKKALTMDYKFPIVPHGLAGMKVIENGHTKDFETWAKGETFSFLPPTSWEGHIEHDRWQTNGKTTDIPEMLGIEGE
ncbi:MAG: DUF362 domain-containing protein [Candidatus Gracilibacteria bacterium]